MLNSSRRDEVPLGGTDAWGSRGRQIKVINGATGPVDWSNRLPGAIQTWPTCIIRPSFSYFLISLFLTFCLIFILFNIFSPLFISFYSTFAPLFHSYFVPSISCNNLFMFNYYWNWGWWEYVNLRRKKLWEDRKYCIMRSFIIYTLHQILLWQGAEDEMGGACSTYGKDYKWTQNYGRRTWRE